jgi:hypothetical protein
MSTLFLQPIAAKRAVNSTGTFYPARCYELPIRRFQFQEGSQHFIRVHNKSLSVVAVRINCPECPPFTIHG